MNKFIVLIICLYFILAPFYLFPSGMPQPADVLVALGGGIFLLKKDFHKIFKLPIIFLALRILGLILIINISYWFVLYAFQGIGNNMYLIPLYYLFNILFMIIFVYIQISREQHRNINIISLFIIISLVIQVILALLGIQGGSKDIEDVGRPSLFFNNPNQLGYYALSMLTLFFVLPNKYIKKPFILFAIIFLSSYLIFYSNSRAAIGGVILISIYGVLKEGLTRNKWGIVLMIIGFFSFPFLLHSSFVQDRLALIETRNERNKTSGVSQAEIRGYDRIYLNPEYLFYGAGEGKNDRFISYHHLEIHSGFGTILFSYGFLGLLMLIHFLYFSMRKNFLYSLILLSPILIYNVTHNGIRNPLFWAIVASIYITNEKQ